MYRRRLWVLEYVVELPDAGIEVPVFADECHSDRLTLTSRQHAQAGLSTTGGLGLASAADRHFAVAVESVCEALTTVLVRATSPLGDLVRATLHVAFPVRGYPSLTYSGSEH